MDRHIAGIPRGHHGCPHRSRGAGDAVPRGTSLGDGAVFAHRPQLWIIPTSTGKIVRTAMRTDERVHFDETLSAYGKARSTVEGSPLDPDQLIKIDAYWRASLYLCLGMLYLKANPLLREPLALEHIKARLLGHWGSDAGQAFTYIHFNRLIKKYDLNAIFVSGPGHGAPAVLAQAYLEGTYSEIYPEKSEDIAGLQRFFKQFSFPGGIGSHATPETPGSIHRGRRARLQHLARLRHRFRQSGPDHSGYGLSAQRAGALCRRTV